MDIKDEIYDFISTHESIIANDLNSRDSNIKVSFTTFGNRAGRKALYDVISILDDDNKEKVLDMMKKKRVL